MACAYGSCAVLVRTWLLYLGSDIVNFSGNYNLKCIPIGVDLNSCLASVC